MRERRKRFLFVHRALLKISWPMFIAVTAIKCGGILVRKNKQRKPTCVTLFYTFPDSCKSGLDFFHAFPQESLQFKFLSRIQVLKELRTFTPRRGPPGRVQSPNHALFFNFTLHIITHFFHFHAIAQQKRPITQSRIHKGALLEPLHRSDTFY